MRGARVSAAPLILSKLAVFTLGTVLLYSREQLWFAVPLEALAVGNLALAVAWDQV